MATKSKAKAKDKKPRKASPKVTMDVQVKGVLKGTSRGEYGYASAVQTFDWELSGKNKVSITAPCGTTYKFDKKTIKDFAALIDKADSAKVVFD